MISRNLARKIANDEDVDVKFSHNVQMLTDFVDTTILVVIAGRGMSKSTVIQSRRSYRCIWEMPGAPLAFVANTYANLKDNIMPAVQKGWEMMGAVRGGCIISVERNRQPPGRRNAP